MYFSAINPKLKSTRRFSTKNCIARRQKSYTRMETLYPDLNASAPPQFDLFDHSVVDIVDALDFCQDIKTLIGTKKDSVNPTVYTVRPWINNTIVIPPIYTPPAYNPVIVREKKNETETDQARRTVKEEKSSEIGFIKQVAAGTMVVAALSATSYYVSQDYNRYVMYENIEKKFRKLQKNMKGLQITRSQSQREIDFLEVYKLWNELRRDVWEDISSDVKTKTSGGIGALGLGLSLVFGSTMGILGGAFFTGYSAAKYIWKRNTRDITFRQFKVLGKKADSFAAMYSLSVE